MKNANNTNDRNCPSDIRTQKWDPTGNAIVYMRLARPESYEAITAEAHRIAERAAANGVQPRLLITATGSGVRHLDERDDLALLLEHASSDWCEWIVTSRFDRISRSTSVLAPFLDRIAKHGSKLVALDDGVTFDTDEESPERQFVRQMLAACEAESRRTMLARMQRGKKIRSERRNERG